ncbi:MAG TPA: DUF6798 domain-containing protein, partial [Gemmataceae bacterium]|nr:DUF6798 domain-containing protein [Gemmataceae bacterium]
AACCIALAATIHSTYLLPGALLTLGFLTALVVEGRARAALSLGAMTFVLVLPAIGYVLSAFGPTSAAEFARAQDIVANFRIPHHARVERWLDPIAALQLAWVAFALFLVWRTRLFIVLGVPFVLMMLLTLVQVVTGNDTLALLFPWRVSAVLVPVATTVILSRLAALRASERGRDARNSGGRDARAPALDTSVARIVCGLIVFAVVAGGVWISVDRQAFRSADEELPLMDFVRQNRKTGDVYLLPVQLPDLKKAPRGSRSGDFKPLAERKTDKAIIPIGLQRFRLYTGTPIFVDFKSIPYEDIEVIEWFERIRITQRVQEQIRLGRLAEVVPNLRRWGVTHLVQPTAQSVPRFTARTVGLLAEPLGHGAFLAATALVHARGQLVYEDPYYQVYRVVTTGK